MTIKMLIASTIAAGALAAAAGPVFASTRVIQTEPLSPRIASTHAGTAVAQASRKKHQKSEQNENENDAPGDAGDQGEQ